MGALVVAGDGDVDELGGGVNVAEGDDGDVCVAALGDGLVVADDQQTQGKRSYRESHLFGGNRKYEKNKKFKFLINQPNIILCKLPFWRPS